MGSVEPVFCPSCSGTSDMPSNGVSVCGLCGASVAVEHGNARYSTVKDTEKMTPAEIAALRHQRAAIVRPSR